MEEPVKHTTPREGYDRWAPLYDAYDNPLIALEEPVVRGLLGDCTDQRIADIGCGTGRHTLWLAAAGARVTGVDFSSGMLEVLRTNAAEAPPQARPRIVEHDLTTGIPLQSEIFDRALCCLVIEHIPRIDEMVAELGRICRPGGRVIISDLHPELVRRGFHARFHEQPGGPKLQIGGAQHTISDYVMAAVRAGLAIRSISEHVMDAQTAERSRSARKWVDLPFLLVLELERSAAR